MTADLTLKELNQFYGTEHYYNVLGFNVTDGVKYVMDNGYSWFVTDFLAVVRCKPEIRKQPFIVAKLHLLENNEGEMVATDGNDNVLYRQHYKFTNAKVELELWLENLVLILPSEH